MFEKEVKREEIRNGEVRDVSKAAIEILDEGLDYMAKHPGEVGGIILGIRPSERSNDKKAICAMAGDMLRCCEQLLAGLDVLFERMDPDMIAFVLDEVINMIPDEKRMETVDIAMNKRKRKIEKVLDELLSKLKDDQNE